MKSRHPMVVGLDIGTTKVCVVVAEIRDEELAICGLGTHPNKGLRKGVVINFESMVTSIGEAVNEAQIVSGLNIDAVYSGISGGHIKTFNSHGMIPLRGREVTKKELERVLDAAGAVAIPEDREILHVLPFEFIVDGQRGIRNPLEMRGMRLEVQCHIITCSRSSTDNLYKCSRHLGMRVAQIIFDPLASAQAVLSPEEKENGVVMLDMGGGTCDIAAYHEGVLVHSAVLPLGGGHITNDIAHGLDVSAGTGAEKLKTKFGFALAEDINPDESVEIEDAGGEQRRFSRQILCEIIEQRCDEIFRLIQGELERAKIFPSTRPSMVLTGGGALLPGLDRLAARIFSTRVRIGRPRLPDQSFELVDDPAFAGAVGLVLLGRESMKRGETQAHGGRGISRFIWKVKEWVSELI